MRNIRIIMMGFLIVVWGSCAVAAEQHRLVLDLTLSDASRIALKNNLDIQIAKFDAYMKRNDLRDAVSIFDTILSGSISYTNDELARASSLVGSKTKTKEYGVDVSKKLPTGTTVGVGFDHTRSESDSAFATTNPYYDSRASISVTQEVGKNFFGLADRAQVRITELDIENADYTSLDKIEESLAAAQKAYWGLVLAQEKVKIRQEMLDRATELYKIYAEKMRTGLAELPDLFAAEANMNIRQNQLLGAQNNLAIAENSLLLQLNYDTREDVELLTRDLFTVERVQRPKFTEHLRSAIKYRRDYKQTLNDVASKNLSVVMKQNSLWPEIDLQASLIRNGVAKKWRHAVSDISEHDNPQYYVGLTFSVPLENSAARGEYQTAQLEKAKSLVLLKQKEREILVSVQDAVTTAQTSFVQARNNIAIVELQEKKLKEEERRFRLGRSNSDTLIRFQNDLLEAKIAWVDSLYRLYSDLIDLRVEENSLLVQYAETAL